MIFGLIHLFIFLVFTPSVFAQVHSCRYIFNPTSIENGINFSELNPIGFKYFAEIKNYQDSVLKPQRGYLRGFEIIVPKEVRAKLELKHDLPLKDVENAFNSWSLGPVRLEVLDHNSRFNDKIRYYFVVQVKNRVFKNGRFHIDILYIKVILDLRFDDSLILISSYRTNKSVYDSYLAERKEL